MISNSQTALHRLSVPIPSPAISFIGRKNSGKTTLLEKVIANLTDRQLRVASVKHHGHPDFDIDIPRRDSYRHRAAGARSVAILSDVRLAQITELQAPLDCESVLSGFSNYDIILVEGFKRADVPHIELFRAANPHDIEAAQRFPERLKNHRTLPVAIVSDITSICEIAQDSDIPLFGFEDIDALSSFVQERFAFPKLSIVIQAGGESRRMGSPKDTIPFLGKPLICHVLDRVACLADELIVTTNQPDRLDFLKDEYPTMTFVADRLEQRGALSGLYTALSTAEHDLVAVIACDMLDVPSALIAHEALLLRPCTGNDHEAIVPRTEAGLEPFASIYRKKACLRQMEPFIEQDLINASIRDLFKTLKCGYIDCAGPVKRARFGGSFINVNTYEDLEAAKTLLTLAPDCLL